MTAGPSRARTFEFDGDFAGELGGEFASELDPVALAGEDGALFIHGDQWFVGLGAAATVALDATEPAGAARTVADVLASYTPSTAGSGSDPSQPAAAGPRAVGALGFDGRGSLTVPVIGIAHDGARTTVTIVDAQGEVTDDDARAAIAARATSVADGRREPAAFTVAASVTPEAWCASVATATARILGGEATKVVLARELTVEADRPFLRRSVLDRLRTSYPGCMVFATAPAPDGTSFVGASPELLVARDGAVVRSHPLAGTAPRHADPAADDALARGLQASTKDLAEHQVTIDMVHDTLLPFCSYLDEEAEPSIVPVANVFHLGTMVEGKLSEPPSSVIELVLTLHPTPAVGGWPVAAARTLIAELEHGDRGHYAGPVGWVDAEGNGAWAVGIRSAELRGAHARLFAGVGVVADSDPDAELAETRAKFQAMLSALVRP